LNREREDLTMGENEYASPAILVFLALSIVYWIASLFTTPRILIEAMDGILIAMSFAVFLAYRGRFLVGLLQQRPSASDMVIVGIALGWLVQAIERSWRVMSRILDAPQMLESPLIGYLLIVITYAASMHLMVRGAVQGTTIRKGTIPKAWASIITAIVCGLAIATIAVTADYFLR
jgi:hypothetical protein